MMEITTIIKGLKIFTLSPWGRVMTERDSRNVSESGKGTHRMDVFIISQGSTAETNIVAKAYYESGYLFFKSARRPK